MMSKVAAFAALLGLGCSSPRFAERSPKPLAMEQPGAQVIGIVRVPAPWYAPRFLIAGKFNDAVPEYEAIDGLQSKYFTISDDRRFGGIYVWKSRRDADAFYTDKWRVGIRERRGADPDLLLLDAPYAIEGVTDVAGEPVGSRSVEYPGTASLLLWSADEPGAATARLAHANIAESGLLRAYVVRGVDRRVGLVALWATRELAEAALSPTKIASLRADLSESGQQVTYFDAPVMIDDAIREGRTAPKLIRTAAAE
ncbi:MAG: monooxygenase [Myxococcaceae bacterium]|nr:monooxygenase [Myxococcaceae bacterium]